MVGDATRKTPSDGLFGQHSLLVHNRLIFINLLGFYAGFHKAYPHFVGITHLQTSRLLRTCLALPLPWLPANARAGNQPDRFTVYKPRPLQPFTG